jgi:Xaa-Pro aminopeptidase
MKLPEVRKYLKKEKLDAIVLFKRTPGFRYFVQGDYENGLIFLSKKANYLFVSPLYAPKFPGFRVVQWKDFKKDFEAFIKKSRVKRVGADNSNLYVKQKTFLRKHFRTKDVSKFLEELRQSKTGEEVARIRKACNIADSIFSNIIKNFRFRTEADLAKFIKINALEVGAEMAFEPIVANAVNAIVAHHEAKSKLKKGFLILDFGIKYKGYVSDMTRTIYLGKPSNMEVELYKKVLDIQQKCLERARVGLRAGSLYNYSIKLFGKDSKYFVHGLGHGIGVEIHEKPSLGLKSKDVLQKGSIFTIEPGYYNKKTGIGIRIEDDVYLGDKKEVLTKSNKKLICINRNLY